ncbi:DMT family transporter [Pukyongiella litopenaei]|uniref:DMT family transporter n=1 Tax=Pukyongiella litopenaei TaxID=2605946 RepID=A0A2S0MRZ9_9RHOB|nr:DMT family transporter [Pukyongiella litopenaei]AVO38521.1 DMT family transporter [Pukyongiella litopenaei]
MTVGIRTDGRANLLGSIWMVAAMAAFAIEDAFLKAASITVPIGQVLILFGLGGAAVFATLARFNGEALFDPDVLSRPMRIRAVFEIVGRLFYGLAIALTPLSAATVILQATPLVVVAGAALVFGERVGWRRWLAIVTGLVGVVAIVQPGTDSFSALSILAVLGMIGFAGRDLASRAAPIALSTRILGLYGFLAIVLAGAIYSAWQGAPLVVPATGAWGHLAAAVLAGVVGYSCLMTAMRTGEVSAVTPFRYSRLLFGVGFGIAFFGESLSASMLVGSGLIVLSGLFILWRGRRDATSA